MARAIELPHNWSPRPYQLGAWKAMDQGIKRLATVWHRRAGKDMTCINRTILEAMRRKANYYHCLPIYNQGRKAVWDGKDYSGRAFLDAFPKEIVRRKNNTDMVIELINGSMWQVVGADNIDRIVGVNLGGVVFSEWSLMNPLAYDYLRPVLRENDAWAWFIYTPRGKNHGWDLLQMARSNPAWYAEVLTIDDTGALTQEDVEADRREGMDESLIQQEYYCFPSGTMIWTNKGQVPIENINVNDVVISHAGRWRKVTKLFRHSDADELLEISSVGSPLPLKCTPNHPVRICNPSDQTYSWVEAQYIKPGDYVVLPRLKTGTAKVIDSDLAELIAWFVTEGSVAKNLIQFTLNKTETAFAKRIKQIAGKYGKASVRENETALCVTVNSCWLADFLTTHCGSGAANKRIPWSLISGHEELFYETLIDGDGCRGDYGSVSEVFTSISYSLALDVQMLAHIIGKRATVNMRPKEKQSSTIQGRECSVSDSYSVRISEIKKPYRNGSRELRPQKHGVASLVNAVSRKPFHGNVYNFSVQFDESYIADGRVVHNCSFSAAALGAYYGKLMEAAQAEGRITKVHHTPAHQVHTAWDLGYDDSTAIWFFQVVHGFPRILYYLEHHGEGLPWYALKLKELASERAWNYGKHFGPHDLEVHDISTGRTRKATAADLGINFTVIPRIKEQREGIEAVRAILPGAYFDEVGCKQGIRCLETYHQEYDHELKKWDDKPEHDWSSHGAKAFESLAFGLRRLVSASSDMTQDDVKDLYLRNAPPSVRSSYGR